MSIALTASLDTPFEDAVARTRKALADQGFGVLTEIDVRAARAERFPPCRRAASAVRRRMSVAADTLMT